MLSINIQRGTRASSRCVACAGLDFYCVGDGTEEPCGQASPTEYSFGGARRCSKCPEGWVSFLISLLSVLGCIEWWSATLSFCKFSLSSLKTTSNNVHNSFENVCKIFKSLAVLKVKIEPFKVPYSPILNFLILLWFQIKWTNPK